MAWRWCEGSSGSPAAPCAASGPSCGQSPTCGTSWRAGSATRSWQTAPPSRAPWRCSGTLATWARACRCGAPCRRPRMAARRCGTRSSAPPRKRRVERQRPKIDT
eukprot:12860007-Alexandrium_andersonii.AAC.1